MARAEKGRPLSPAREQLSQQQAALSRHRQEVAAAKEAASIARGRKYAAEERRDSLIEAQREQQADVAPFIASVRQGAPDFSKLDEGRGFVEQLREANKQLDTWGLAAEECGKAERDLEAQIAPGIGIREMARRILAEEADLASFLSGFEEVFAEYRARLGCLNYLNKEPISAADKRAISAILNRAAFMASELPSYKLWAGALAALETDARAPIPILADAIAAEKAGQA